MSIPVWPLSDYRTHIEVLKYIYMLVHFNTFKKIDKCLLPFCSCCWCQLFYLRQGFISWFVVCFCPVQSALRLGDTKTPLIKRYDGALLIPVWNLGRNQKLLLHRSNLRPLHCLQRSETSSSINVSGAASEKLFVFFRLNPLKQILSSGSNAQCRPPCFCLWGQRSHRNPFGNVLATIRLSKLWTHLEASIFYLFIFKIMKYLSKFASPSFFQCRCCSVSPDFIFCFFHPSSPPLYRRYRCYSRDLWLTPLHISFFAWTLQDTTAE